MRVQSTLPRKVVFTAVRLMVSCVPSFGYHSVHPGSIEGFHIGDHRGRAQATGGVPRVLLLHLHQLDDHPPIADRSLWVVLMSSQWGALLRFRFPGHGCRGGPAPQARGGLTVLERRRCPLGVFECASIFRRLHSISHEKCTCITSES